MKNTAIVFKLSPSGKSMLVGVTTSKYAVGYTFAWARNPDGKCTVKQKLTDFAPTGREECRDEQGNVITHQDGTPVMRWTF